MLNNKGFAVSAVLYTTLIAFLLFLAVVLSVFSSSSDLVRNANTDLINGNKFEAKQVTLKNSDGEYKKCVANLDTPIAAKGEFYWYDSPVIVKINSRYGTYYWPKDFDTFSDRNNNNVLDDGEELESCFKTCNNSANCTFNSNLDYSFLGITIGQNLIKSFSKDKNISLVAYKSTESSNLILDIHDSKSDNAEYTDTLNLNVSICD